MSSETSDDCGNTVNVGSITVSDFSNTTSGSSTTSIDSSNAVSDSSSGTVAVALGVSSFLLQRWHDVGVVHGLVGAGTRLRSSLHSCMLWVARTRMSRE